LTIDDYASTNLEFDDNEVLMVIAGPHDRHLTRIEQRLGISIVLRGNTIQLKGPEPEVSYAKGALLYLQSQIQKGFAVDSEEVESAIRMASATVAISPPDYGAVEEVSIATKRRMVFPRTAHQAEYIQQLKTADLVLGIGPAGTGKTYLAAAVGVWMLLSGKVEKIILSRPAVEAGERLGFLPGDMREKVDPYLRPLYDALYDMLPAEQVLRRLTNGEIEVAPLAFMRGRTLSNAFVILDEAQNTTPMQMKMFLTRLGNNSRMVVTGDITQIDLPYGVKSGLKEAMRILRPIEEVKIIEFNEKDVVRHPLVSLIVHAYEKDTSKHKETEDA
jgi:phosphate starvation-inducible PhoH-like protein